MKSPKANALLFLLGFVGATAACQRVEQLTLEKQAQDVLDRKYYLALSLDTCLQDPSSCLKAFSGQFEIPAEFRTIKLLGSSKVFEDVSLEALRDEDLRSPEGAALVTVATQLKVLKDAALKAGFEIPQVAIDPLCLLSQSEHNAFYLPEYGATDESTLHNVICLGFTKAGQNRLPLSLDKAILAHEYFHALLFHTLVKEAKDVPAEVVKINHDLEAFNEGLADHFAERVTGNSLSQRLLESRGLVWRTKNGRKHLRSTAEFYGNIYHDGARWTELAGSLAEEGIETLGAVHCTLTTLREELKAKAAAAHEKSQEFTFEVKTRELLESFSKCLGENPAAKEAFAKHRFEIFHDILPDEADSLSQAELAVVAITNKQALCAFSSAQQLSPESLLWYQTLDACGGQTTLAFNGAPLTFPEREQSAHPSLHDEPVYLLVGMRPTHGHSGTDCRLKGPRSLKNSEILLPALSTGEELLTLPVPQTIRGFWHADVAFGSFSKDAVPEEFALGEGPLRALSQEFRFVPYKTGAQGFAVDGKSSVSLNGQIVISGFRYPDAVKSRSEKNTFLANTIQEVYGAHNFALECLSHSKPVAISQTRAFVYDCREEDAQCDVRSY